MKLIESIKVRRLIIIDEKRAEKNFILFFNSLIEMSHIKDAAPEHFDRSHSKHSTNFFLLIIDNNNSTQIKNNNINME